MMNQNTSRTLVAAALAAFSQACTGATTGAAIPVYAQPRTAVLAVDLQRDFLADDGRMPIERAQREPVLRASNAVIDAAHEAGVPVVYVGNEFAASDLLANLFRHHAAMRGTPGAELDPRVHRSGDVYFAKDSRDAFTNPALDAHLRRLSIDHLVVLGIAADACVRATVLGARNRGYRVTVVSDGVGASSARARDGALLELAEAGAVIAPAADVAPLLAR